MEVCRRRVANWALPALLILFASAVHAANPFAKVGEIDLNERLAALGEPRMDDLSVWSVSFSPDGSRLAIAFGAPAGSAPPTWSRYLLVVLAAHPETTVYWANLARINPAKPALIGEPVWAPDGNSLAYPNFLIRVPGGEACRVPGNFGGFLSAATALISIPDLSSAASQSLAPSPPTTFAAIDSQCRILERQGFDRYSRLDGMSPDGHLLALLAPVEPSQRGGMDLSARGGTDLILVRLPLPDLKSGLKIHFAGPPVGITAVFLNAGTVVCAPYGKSQYRRQPPYQVQIGCWDTETGTQVRQGQPVWTDLNMRLSAGGGRIAVNDSGRPGNGGTKAILRQHGIWDFATNKMTAKWSPEVDATNPTALGNALGFAISPDGRLLAEAGSASVRFYRLP